MLTEKPLNSIPITKIKKDNSNITYYSRTLWKELRKERFRPLKQEQYERFFNYCLAVRQLDCDPYADIDFQIDLDKFKSTLSDRERECLEYFMENIKQEDIASMVGISQTLVSFILSNVFIKFSLFYGENIEEDVGINQFKKHLRKAEVECFDLYLDGLTYAEMSEMLGITKAALTSRLSSVFNKFYAFFGVNIDE